MILSKALPEEKILDELKDSLDNYRILQTSETKDKFKMFLLMASARFMTEDKGIMETVTQMDDLDKALRIHENLNNNKQ